MIKNKPAMDMPDGKQNRDPQEMPNPNEKETNQITRVTKQGLPLINSSLDKN